MASFENGFALNVGIANYPEADKLPPTVLKDAKDIYDVLCSSNHWVIEMPMFDCCWAAKQPPMAYEMVYIGSPAPLALEILRCFSFLAMVEESSEPV